MTYTFQALSEEDIKAWLDAMDGKEPVSIAVICISPRCSLRLEVREGIINGADRLIRKFSTMILMHFTFADQPDAINKVQRR